MVVAPRPAPRIRATRLPRQERQGAKTSAPTILDLVVIPGGFAARLHPPHRCDASTVSTMAEQGKGVAAIVTDPGAVFDAGVERPSTFLRHQDDVINAGATYVDAEVVRDGNLVTSRKPDDLPGLCRRSSLALYIYISPAIQPECARRAGDNTRPLLA